MSPSALLASAWGRPQPPLARGRRAAIARSLPPSQTQRSAGPGAALTVLALFLGVVSPAFSQRCRSPLLALCPAALSSTPFAAASVAPAPRPVPIGRYALAASPLAPTSSGRSPRRPPPQRELRGRPSRGKLALLLAASAVATYADVRLARYAVSQRIAHEVNPIGMRYELQTPITLEFDLTAIYLRQKRYRDWWIPQFALITAHGVGAISALVALHGSRRRH